MKYFALLVSAIAVENFTQAQFLTGPTPNPGNGHIYYLTAATNWNAAEALALSVGGHLVTINNAAEDAWVFGQFSSFGGTPRPLWIGLTDAAQEGVFTWVSGEPVTYLNWS